MENSRLKIGMTATLNTDIIIIIIIIIIILLFYMGVKLDLSQ
jgi:hypothetical protein